MEIWIYSLSFIEPLSKASLPAFMFPHSFLFSSLHKLHSNLFTGFYLPDMVMDFDEISIGIGDSHIQSRLLHIFQKLN